ncbi:MAG: acyl-CoA dehydrogenase family protein [Acidobacteria bacterium]|nr:acyl-CoA dehydrogenase family protein [Acidobacteriota bacterium]MBI3489732.1 acyl-CoA dehydrogenase family protein [Acidobacteriota bacterium]
MPDPILVPAAQPQASSEEESRKLAEGARETAWVFPSFLKEIFGGRFDLGLLASVPQPAPARPGFAAFHARMKAFLSQVDSDRMDREGAYLPEALQALKDMGAFGMKVPAEYGGLGFSQWEYGLIMELLGSQDANLLALLSAHQSIGVPQPLKLFGTEEQKARYLPRIAEGAVSAFALTEREAGSDPANLRTTLRRTPEGGFLLSGEKLWCTNGTIADFYVVMARHDDTREISAVIVERAWEGVEVVRRCRFMGLRALENGVVRFKDVRVPKENLLLGEGKGLKLALVTLNTGRLSIPSALMGAFKRLVQIHRAWDSARIQWGQPIGRHEAIGQTAADCAATAFAVEAVAQLCNRMADAGDRDIRLEAAMAKMWTTEEAWTALDRVLQARGGRGYETADSLRARGEAPIPVERMMRDARINLIFEGSSEIMRLFIAREAVDMHLAKAWDLVNPKSPLGQRLKALPRALAFYAAWYPARWFGLLTPFHHLDHTRLGGHLRFAERRARKLGRALFHQMLRHGPRLERKQATLFRAVEIGADLFAMCAAVLHARDLERAQAPHAKEATDLADLFCLNMRRRIAARFRDLRIHSDGLKARVSGQLLDGAYRWMEEDLVPSEAIDSLEPGGGGGSVG